jgi:hypothetical protein
MPQTLIYKVERLNAVPGETHRETTFFIRPGSRRRSWKFFHNGAVPEFEGKCAWFEIERRGPLWIFHRQVPPPPAKTPAGQG